jgi:hypothetical protein
MLEAGGKPEDLEALRWSAPGTARRNMLAGLSLYRQHGRAAVAALVEELESRPDGCWERWALYRIAGMRLSAEVSAAISRREWKLLLAVVMIERPDLAANVHRGADGPRWVAALANSGWQDSAVVKEPISNTSI